MIALPDEATCPNCQGQPKPKKTCWACRNRGRVEAWRVCPTCGRWIDGCMCPRESHLVEVANRRPGRPRTPRPAPPAPERADEIESLSAENIGGGMDFRGSRSRPPPSH